MRHGVRRRSWRWASSAVTRLTGWSTRALSAGATPSKQTDEQTAMYVRSLSDIGGHLWEIFHMDPAAVQ